MIGDDVGANDGENVGAVVGDKVGVVGSIVVGAAVLVRGGRCVVATSTPWTRWRAAAAGWRCRM